jgi:hypothetical protein
MKAPAINDDVRLNEFGKAEWFDIARKLKPNLTEDEYNLMWDEFQQAKRQRGKN